MKKSVKSLLASILLSAVSLSVAQIPQLGRASDALWSEHEELSIGRAAYDRLRRSGDLYESQADLDYLNYLGNKIGAFADTRLGLTFYLTRESSINAFAMPGGYIAVNAGLVLVTDSEHELAGVLGHEIAHVSQEHIARTTLAAKDRQLANAAALIASAVVAIKGNGKAGAAAFTSVVAGETQNQINDIRRHEIEADRVGRRLMTDAGFNELGMQLFFGKLYTPSALNNIPSFLLTHPLPERRQAAIDSLKKRSKNLSSRDEYYLFRARIQAEFLPKKEVNRLIQQAQKSDKAQLRDAGIYLSALEAMKFGQLDAALSALSGMKTPMRNNRDVELMRAKLYLLKADNAKANAIYKKLWQRFAGDSVVAFDYAQFLKQRGKLQKAATVLEKQMDVTQNPQLHWLYGEILGQLGERAKQYRSLIRYYRQIGEYEQALTQAKIAARQPELGWQARAGFEAQEKELQHLIDALKTVE